MAYIIKKTLVILMAVILIQAVFIQLASLDQTLLRDLAQTLLIALCLQPWIVHQLTH